MTVKQLPTIPTAQRPPFSVSPSAVARYFFHDCERFLRFRSAGPERRAAEGIPKNEIDHSALMRAIFQSGNDWEVEVLTAHLGTRAMVAAGTGPPNERRFDVDATAELLRSAKPGRFLYQLTLRQPARFYAEHGVPPELVWFADCHPDLVEVLAGPNGGRRLRVIDVKRGESLRPAYAVQVALYALALDAIVRELGIADTTVDLETGAAWLGGQPAPTLFDLRTILPHLRRFLRHDLPRVLAAEAAEAAWHVGFRCEWCDYFDHCRDEMKATNDLSRLPGLTAYGKRHLRAEQVKDLPALRDLLRRPDADEVLDRCASLAGRKHPMLHQVEALLDGAARDLGSSSPALPKFEHVAVYVTTQREPLGKRLYAAGVLLGAKDETRMNLGLTADRPAPEVRVARTPAETADVRRWLVESLDDILGMVHRFNDGKDWKEQLSVQLYVLSEQERALVVTALLEALQEDATLAAPAIRLLLHLHGPDLVRADTHPADAAPHPITVLLGALGRLVALPVDVTPRLPEALLALGATFTYERREAWHFPFGPGLRSDAVHAAWFGGRPERIDAIARQAQQHLYAVRALHWSLRARVHDQLALWSPKFRFPDPLPIRSPLLSRLAFFARYESLLRCLDVQGVRAEPRPVQLDRGAVALLEAQPTDGSSARWFKVLEPAPATLDASDFPAWLLVPDDEPGRQAQLGYPDYAYRTKARYAKQHPQRAVARVDEVESDPDDVPLRVAIDVGKGFAGDRAVRDGERFLLLPIFTDYTSDRVIEFLQDLDASDRARTFLELVNDPAAAARRSAPLPPEVEAAARRGAAALGLTGSQQQAYDALRARAAVGVWGPPGTGKTHALAAMIDGLAVAHAACTRPLRVLVTAFTHAAIENVLRKLAQRFVRPAGPGTIRLRKAKRWDGAPIPGAEVVADDAIAAATCTGGTVVIGATVYSCLKALRDSPDLCFDLVIVDEASQVRVPEAAIPVSLVAPGGRLVLAGDHRQLPPIVAGRYPDPEPGQPVLHRSVFELLVGGGHGIVQLLENFRMNDVLTAAAGGQLYGSSYVPANPTVASRRLPWRPTAGTPPCVAAALDPAFPLVVIVLDGVVGTTGSAPEARLVGDLVVALREGLSPERGEPPYADDAAFFRDGLFVVSPHHVQIRAIHRELRGRRAWTSEPFVDTVDKMQGQEAEAVVVSYGVADPEQAALEAEFIYGLERLNVAATRARTKTVVILPRPLLDATPGVLENEAAALGLAYMRSLVERAERGGDRTVFDLGRAATATVLRCGSP